MAVRMSSWVWVKFEVDIRGRRDVWEKYRWWWREGHCVRCEERMMCLDRRESILESFCFCFFYIWVMCWWCWFYGSMYGRCI